MNFNILGFMNVIPKTMTVTLQNDAKKHYPFLEGIYNLSTSGKNPKWKIIRGPHEIESYSGTWRIREYGSNSKIMKEDQSNDQMPDDDNYECLRVAEWGTVDFKAALFYDASPLLTMGTPYLWPITGLCSNSSPIVQ